MSGISSFWSIAWGIGTIISVISITVYMTRRNTSAIDGIKNNEISELYNENKNLKSEIDKKIDEKEARKEFVSKELYENQMKHIDETLGEIKTDQKEILGLLRK